MLIKPYNEGIELVVNKIILAENKPFVLSVTGSPNSGKTHFRKDIKERLEKLGIFGWSFMGGDEKDSGTCSIVDPSYVTIEDIEYSKSLEEYSIEIISKRTNFNIFMCKRLTKFDIEFIDVLKKLYGERIFDLAITNPYANDRFKLYKEQ